MVQVVEVVGVSISISNWSCFSSSLSSSFSISICRPLANVVVVAIVTSKGIGVAVVGMSIGKMGIGVAVPMVQVVEIVGVSLSSSLSTSISSCLWSSIWLSFSSSFCSSSRKKEESSSNLSKELK